MGDSWVNFNVVRCAEPGIAAISPAVEQNPGGRAASPGWVRLMRLLRHLPGGRQVEALPELLVGGLSRQRIAGR